MIMQENNCYSEDVYNKVIDKRIAAKEACFSQRKKPDEEIFIRCLSELNLSPEECIYVGDGGSNELEAAKLMQMQPLQATWYLKGDNQYQMKRLDEFEQLNTPSDLFDYIRSTSLG